MAGFPGHAVFELTYRCNYRCRFCYCANRSAARELTGAAWLDALREMRVCGGARTVTLTGGEPLLHPDALTLARAAREEGVECVQVFTNAGLLDAARIDALAACGATVCVSLSGRGTYRAATGGGCYDDVLARIGDCVARGMPVAVSSVLTRENVGEMASVAADCLSAGAWGIQFGFIMHEGAALRSRDLWLSLRQRTEARRLVRELGERHPDRRVTLADETVCACRNAFTRACARLCGRRCKMGVTTVVVSPDGWVRPCVHESGRRPFALFTDEQRQRFQGVVRGRLLWA